MSLPAPLSPRTTAHHGVVDAVGFWLSSALLSPEAQSGRVLSLWSPGTEVFDVEGGHLVLFRRPQRVAAGLCPGAPLTLDNGILSSAPLTKKERAQLPPSTELVIVEASIARCMRRSDLAPIDISRWLNLSVFQLREARSLGTPQLVTAVPDQLSKPPDTRALFDERTGRSAADYEQQLELVRAIESAGETRSALGRNTFPFLEQLHGAWTSVRGWLAGRANSRRKRSHPQAKRLPAGSTVASLGLMQRLRAGFARWFGRTRLMALLNRKQAAYLRELLQLLAERDDLEVLRRAIPLGNGTDPSSLDPALSPPKPRSTLEISLARKGGGPTLNLHGDFFEQLRRSYEAVFERLDQAGKHAEAAFFLAEILNQPERAVSYLERHQRLRLAAELAEARKLPAGLIVRQWFLAGDQQRAVAIAVREGAFDDAISRLERSGAREQAGALRILQAERMASAGRFVAAARLACRVDVGRALALRWLELSRQAGDVLGLALELSLDEARFDVVQSALTPLLREPGPDAIQRRSLVAEDLVRLNVTVGKSLARELTRQILADAGALGDRALANTAGATANWVGGTFEADLPTVASFQRLRTDQTVRHRYSAHECGTRALHDLHPCGSRFLVALGEGGVALVARDGKQVAHFDTPAEHLVVSQDGWRVLAVTSRGNVLHVGRIDLATRRSEHWGEVRARSFAKQFDGETWLVHDDPTDGTPQLVLLDTLDNSPTAVRRIPLPGDLGLTFIDVDPLHCNAIGAELFGPLERIRYELPSWTLRERSRVDLGERPDEAVFVGNYAASGSAPPVVCGRWFDPKKGLDQPPIRLQRGAHEVPIALDDAFSTLWLSVSTDDFCVAQQHTDSITVHVGSFPASRVLLELELEGAQRVAVRLSGGRIALCDDTGRLLDFDLTSTSCLRDLRL